MKLRKILFPTDFSPASEAAMVVSTAVARETGARMVIAHVKYEPNAQGENCTNGGAIDDVSLSRMLEEIHPADPAVPHAHRLLSGRPAEQILKLADAEHADLIVMSTHGRTGLSRMLMGSVAEEVVRRADCPVLIVKQASPGSGEGEKP